MQFTMKVDDSLFEHYVKAVGIPGCYARMRKILEDMKDLNPNDRYLVIEGDIRRDIEAVFQTTIDTPTKLARLIRNMSTVKIHGVEHTFTEDEMARIAMQASFHGRTTEQFMKEMITEIAGMMLEKV